MDQLHLLRAFVAVAQHRSFAKAASSLGVTTGSVSKAIARLEERLQTRVLHRTTRSVTLTEAAQTYYVICSRLLQEFDEADQCIRQAGRIDSGTLRLAVHPTVVGSTLSELIWRYRTVAPNVTLVASIVKEPTNLLDGKYDLAIMPPHLVEQPAVIRRTLIRSSRIFVASKEYLGRYGRPLNSADLAEHFLLTHPKIGGHSQSSVVVVDHGHDVPVTPMFLMEGDDALLLTAALGSVGIAILPRMMIAECIASGQLAVVLPGCSIGEGHSELCLFYAHRELLPARVRTFVDFCAEFFSQLDSQRSDAMSAITVDCEANRVRDRQRKPPPQGVVEHLETMLEDVDVTHHGSCYEDPRPRLEVNFPKVG